MLNVFSINVCATFYFVSLLIPRKFNILPNILNERFMVTTSVGESMVAKLMYINLLIMFLNRVTHVELVELYMVDFDVILGTDWLHA